MKSLVSLTETLESQRPRAAPRRPRPSTSHPPSPPRQLALGDSVSEFGLRSAIRTTVALAKYGLAEVARLRWPSSALGRSAALVQAPRPSPVSSASVREREEARGREGGREQAASSEKEKTLVSQSYEVRNSLEATQKRLHDRHTGAVVVDAEKGCRVVTVWRMTTFIAMGESISFMEVTRML